MKVQLLQHVKKIGQKGDIVDVADGYANSFLIPKKFAKPASNKDALLKQTLENKSQEREQLMITQEENLFKRLNDSRISVESPSNPQGHLFGAVGKGEIGAALPGLKSDYIILKNSIKETGVYDVPIIVGKQKGTIHLTVR